MAESYEELEPLFDYRRVQPFSTPFNPICLDDDSPDSSPVLSKKRKMIDSAVSKKEDKNEAVLVIIDCNEKEEDWLPPSPKISAHTSNLVEDSTIKEIRKESASFAELAKDELRDVEESVKRDLNASLHSLQDSVAELPSKPSSERAKIVISIQDKDGAKQFRIYAVWVHPAAEGDFSIGEVDVTDFLYPVFLCFWSIWSDFCPAGCNCTVEVLNFFSRCGVGVRWWGVGGFNIVGECEGGSFLMLED